MLVAQLKCHYMFLLYEDLFPFRDRIDVNVYERFSDINSCF